MKKAYLSLFKILVIAILAGIFSCRPDPYPEFTPGDLRITYKVLYDGEPYVMGNDIRDYHGDDFKINEFSFFVSNLALVKEIGGDRVPLSEVDLIHLDEISSEDGGVLRLENSIPEGEYVGLAISYGVPADLNQTEYRPGQYGPGHPLSDETMVKPGKGYKFMVFSGQTAAQPDGILNDKVDYEIYGNNLFQQERIFQIPIEISELKDARIDVKIDIKDFLDKNPPPIDILQQSKTTESNMRIFGGKLMRNLKTTMNIGS